MRTIDKHEQLVRTTAAIMSTLAPKERKIILLRWGLLDGVFHTLEEVGKEFGVTRERIRQIEAKAIERMRLHSRDLEFIHNPLVERLTDK